MDKFHFRVSSPKIDKACSVYKLRNSFQLSIWSIDSAEKGNSYYQEETPKSRVNTISFTFQCLSNIYIYIYIISIYIYIEIQLQSSFYTLSIPIELRRSAGTPQEKVDVENPIQSGSWWLSYWGTSSNSSPKNSSSSMWMKSGEALGKLSNSTSWACETREKHMVNQWFLSVQDHHIFFDDIDVLLDGWETLSSSNWLPIFQREYQGKIRRPQSLRSARSAPDHCIATSLKLIAGVSWMNPIQGWSQSK